MGPHQHQVQVKWDMDPGRQEVHAITSTFIGANEIQVITTSAPRINAVQTVRTSASTVYEVQVCLYACMAHKTIPFRSHTFQRRAPNPWGCSFVMVSVLRDGSLCRYHRLSRHRVTLGPAWGVHSIFNSTLQPLGGAFRSQVSLL